MADSNPTTCSVRWCESPATGRGMCALHYGRWYRKGYTYRPSPLELFWGRIDHSGGPDSCWQWTFTRCPQGYGRSGKTTSHRMVWLVAVGPIPPGLFVCHKCDNPPCCNPAHLFLGTPADNVADMAQKGRNRRGERHGRAKLTTRDVLEIRASGESSQVLGERFGVTRNAVDHVRTGKNWKYV